MSGIGRELAENAENDQGSSAGNRDKLAKGVIELEKRERKQQTEQLWTIFVSLAAAAVLRTQHQTIKNGIIKIEIIFLVIFNIFLH